MRTVFFGSNPDQPQPPSEYVAPLPLSAEELRVLGCLIEKQFLTPDIYPMSLHAIMTACNQKTSREPVTDYDEATVDAVLAMLQQKGLVARISGPEHRVPKSKELFSAKANLRVSELAVLCVMMLRGPQTLNELQTRTNRIHGFADAQEVEQTLERLIARRPQPLAARLQRVAGQKEQRFMHLLAGEEALNQYVASASSPAPAPREDRLAQLEREVEELRRDLASLREQFTDFRNRFEQG